MPPRKKQKEDGVAKPKRATRRGNTGKLARLLEMPVDIWFEIVSHLTPKELLHLTWTSRHFREMFMDKRQKHLWAAARYNARVPDPPPHISEPFLAAVLYSSFCQACGNRGQKYDLGLVQRFCGGCWKLNMKLGFVCQREYDFKWDDPFLQYVPSSKTRSPSSNESGEQNEEYGEYFVPEFEWMLERYRHYEETGKKEKLKAFVEERKLHVKTMREFTKGLRHWEAYKKNAKQALEDAMEDGVKRKLIEMGYKETDIPAFQYGGNPRWCEWREIVRQPRDLTDRIWKNMMPRLLELLEEEQPYQEEREREDRRREREEETCIAYRELLPNAPVEDGPFPRVSAALRLPEIHRLMREDDARIPMTEERLRTALPALRSAAREQKAKLVELAWAHFAALSQPEGAAPGAESAGAEPAVMKLKGVPEDIEHGSEAILELATALFRCHLCFNYRDQRLPGVGDAMYSITELAKHVHTDHAREVSFPGKSEVDSAVARKVLHALGLPEDIRHAELTGKIVCKCATFKHPSTFAELVTHIMRENSAYHAAVYCRSASACPAHEVIIHDHDLDNDPSFLRLLSDANFEPPPLAPDEGRLAAVWSAKFPDKEVICTVCYLCSKIPYNSEFWRRPEHKNSCLYVPRAVHMEPEELARHVRTKHSRKARPEDAMEAPDKVSWNAAILW
ncbi:F-box protein [Phanerochaete sordida]|uniref:F-box protein n=1 Tax=Phanerochaete sordida TaxID=48140 RepID=A0A9P3LGD6_9APHY|nr:F-box protein [Phanerochaete sordida]